MTAPDLPSDLTYVVNNGALIWHIAQIAEPTIPNALSLCGRRARDGRWSGQCQGVWMVTKLCLSCRAALKQIAR